MSKIEQLEKTVLNLSPKDLAQFRAWFLEFDARVWDEQIETDLKAGKLDTLIAEARTEFEEGKVHPLRSILLRHDSGPPITLSPKTFAPWLTRTSSF